MAAADLAGSQLAKCIAAKTFEPAPFIHSFLLKTALNLHPFLANRLLHLYSLSTSSALAARKVFLDLPVAARNDHSHNAMLAAFVRDGRFADARRLFDQMPNPTSVSYNTLISGLVHQGRHAEAIGWFTRMNDELGSPAAMDRFTVVGVANACAQLGSLRLLRQLHGAAIACAVGLNTVAENSVVDAYGKCGDARSARFVFDGMLYRDVVSWTSMVVVYARAGQLADARKLFDEMPNRNSVTWTALITGFAQNECGEMAIEMFRLMQDEDVETNDFTCVGVLSACASLASIEFGKQVHCYLLRGCRGGVRAFNIFVYNALIDLYAKCGDMRSASLLFSVMSERDVVSWNSIITGFALNGLGRQSLPYFLQMVEARVLPNGVTFRGVLAGCSHAGFVSDGCRLLKSMQGDYGVRPCPEHYAIIIDALGRKKRFMEAMTLIEEADCGVGQGQMWGALLGACHIHGRLDIAKMAAKKLFDADPSNAARYVTLSNIYAFSGRWDDVRAVWDLMKEKGLRKDQACSWIEVENMRHCFVADDKDHEDIENIYAYLDTLTDEMKKAE